MKILITNDDGYKADGINALYDALAPHHDVYECAPLNQKSASGHSISLFKKMELLEFGPNRFAVDGTPADTVKVAIFGVFQDIDFDMVISGINDGPNMGHDIYYSGTFAGAREGLINNIFSIACSYDGWDNHKHFKIAADIMLKIVNHITPEMYKDKIILNINFPPEPPYKGLKITHLGERVYRDIIHFEELGSKVFATIGGETPAYNSDPGSDLDVINDGYISLTPLRSELYEKQKIDSYKVFDTLDI